MRAALFAPEDEMVMKRDCREIPAQYEKTVLSCVLLLIIVMLLAYQPAPAASLVKDGRAQAVIVIADNPSPVASYAATELATHVQKATGAELPIVHESSIPDGYASHVFVGVTRSAAAQGIDPEKLDNDAFVLRTVGNDLYVVGREDASALPLDQNHGYSGTMFGVSEILERYVAVRWLWPGKLGTYVPRTDTIAVENVDQVIGPKLLVRAISYGTHLSLFKSGDGSTRQLAFGEFPELYRQLSFNTPEKLVRYMDDLEIFMRRHRLGYSQPLKEEAERMRSNRIEHSYRLPQPRHGFHGWWDLHGKEHPEWFAMRKDGVRGPWEGQGQQWWGGQYAAMCVSNPDLHRFIIDEVMQPGRVYNVGPRTVWDGRAILDLSEADGAWEMLCQCANCQAWDEPLPEGQPPIFAADKYRPRTTSNRYARFYQTMYNLAVKKVPDVKVLGYIYHDYTPAPTADIRLGKNVICEFVIYGENGGWHPMTVEEDQWWRQQWLGWSKTGMSLILRPNYMLSGYVMPEITTRQIVDFFNFAYKNGMVAAYYDSLRDHWAANGPMSYLHYRLLWEPELSAEQIRGEYFSAFGPAAKQVEEYFDYWEYYVHTTDYLNARPPIKDEPGGPVFNWMAAYADTSRPPLRDEESGIIINWYPMMRRAAGAVMAFPERVYPPAEAMLERALAAADNDSLPEFSDRVKFLQAGLEHAKLSARIWRYLAIDPNGYASPPKEETRLANARQAMKQLIDFRRDHQEPYVADYITAVDEEKAILDIHTLFSGSEEITARETAFRTRWPEKATRNPEDAGLRLMQSIELPHIGWQFQKDPERQGDELKWHLPEMPEGEWQDTEIARYWADDYVGVGWYRGKFQSPDLSQGNAAFLEFGAVDESCWVWVNGVFIGVHAIGPDGWDKPFRLEITEALKPGDNVIVVRAENIAYAGGIWKPINLEIYAPTTDSKSKPN